MQIKVDEITDILRRQIEGLDTSVEMAEVGTVVSVGDGIARVFGLDNVMAGEMVELPHDVYGLALNLEEDGVGCVLMGETQQIQEGDEVRRTGRILSVPVKHTQSWPLSTRNGTRSRKKLVTMSRSSTTNWPTSAIRSLPMWAPVASAMTDSTEVSR